MDVRKLIKLISNTPRVEAYFSKAEKKMSVFKNIRIRVDRVLCPVHTCPFLFEKGRFLSPVCPTIRTYPVKTVTENQFSLKRSPK